MRPGFVLFALVLLAACSSPREQCIETATRDLRTLDHLIAETRATIERGFALRTETRYNPVVRLCGRGDHVHLCTWNVPYERTRAVAVNLSEERQKLRSMEKQRPAIAKRTARTIASCQASFPE